MKYVPSYINLYKEGILEERANAIYEIIQECKLCPHNCGVNRIKSEKGKCNSASLPIVSSYNLHFGEESCLVGNSGSGTIFFTNCNLSCIFCQNYDISHLGYGNEISYEELAKTILSLQAR